jgi:hypothetical protein
MLDVEKTKFLVLNGKNVAIEDFPKKIRQEIDLFDDIKTDLRDAEKRVRILVLALTAQNSKVGQLIEQYTKSSEAPISPAAERDV